MYRDCFGLRYKPFGNTPDPTFFYFSADHRQALVTLSRGIRERCGLFLLVGDVGTGKTTLCNHIHNHDGYLSAYLNNPFLTELEFLEMVNQGLGIPGGDGSRKGLRDNLHDYLIRQYFSGKPVILIIDEAHRLGLPVLDQVLSLSNLQLSDANLLQIILAGHSDLLSTLANPHLRSLNQRIGVRCNLRNMDRADSVDYVNFRLGRAGCEGRSLFSAKALEEIWKRSRGTPRLINHLCERALNEAYLRGKRRVGAGEVRRMVKDPLYHSVFPRKVKSWQMRTAFAGSVLALCIGVSLGLWYFGLGSKFVREHAQVEQRTVIRKPIIIPSLAEKSGNESTSPGLIVDGGPVSVATLGEEAPAGPELQQPYRVSIIESLEERMAEETQMSPIDALPDLKLSAIAWDEDASKSIAVLDDKILHEGDFLGDVRLLRIKPNHVVLIHEDEHVIKRIHKLEQDHTPEATSVRADGEQETTSARIANDEQDAEEASLFSDLRPIINFDYRTSKLAPEAYEELDRIAILAKLSPNYDIVLRGYADNVGSYRYNKRLSKSRANIVQSYLVEKGVDPARIKTFGMGETNPLMPNTTPVGRAANRRVEIEFVPVDDY